MMQNDTVTLDYLITGVREAMGQVAIVCDDGSPSLSLSRRPAQKALREIGRQ